MCISRLRTRPNTGVLLLAAVVVAAAVAVRPAAAGDAHLIEKEMTFTVDAGRNDCFYQTVRTGQTIDLEYQVTNI